LAPISLCGSVLFFWLAAKELLSGQVDKSGSIFSLAHVVYRAAEPGKFFLIVCWHLLMGAGSFSVARQQWRLRQTTPDQAGND